MPNAILRAGPFASSSNSFLDEPGTPSSSFIPVTCANDTSSSVWPWKYLEVQDIANVTHTGCDAGGLPTSSTSNTVTSSYKTATGDFSISHSSSSNNTTILTTTFQFAYQAVQSFQIKVTFSGLASSANLPAGSSFSQPDFMGFSDSQTTSPVAGFPSISGSVTRTLPAAVVPAFYFATIQVSSKISFPTDVCTPNSGSANAAATLTVEFL